MPSAARLSSADYHSAKEEIHCCLFSLFIHRLTVRLAVRGCGTCGMFVSEIQRCLLLQVR